MKIRQSRGRPGQEGMALMFATISVFAAAALVSVTLTVATSANRRTQVDVNGTIARYQAEGASEVAKREIQNAIANWQPVPDGGTAIIDGVEVAYTITPTGFQQTITEPSGIQTYATGYAIESQAMHFGNSGTAQRIINSLATPIFQFAVFYTQDLEINPGANMTLGGRVHSNADMYLGSNATLTCNTNYLRAVGSIYRNRKDAPSQSLGTVKIRKWVADPFDGSLVPVYFTMNSKSQMTSKGVTTVGGYDSNFSSGYDASGDGDFTDLTDWLPFGPGALEYWDEPDGYTGGSGNTVMTSEHGMSMAVTPQIGSVKMFEEEEGGSHVWDATLNQYVPAAEPGLGTHSMGYYHGEADLSLLTYADGSWKAFNKAGAEITSSLASVVSNTQMYDARQANGTTTKIKLTEINMAALNSSGLFPANGLLYAARYGEGTGTSAGGIRLVNGAELHDKLTVVSEDPIYIKGDYNTVAKKGASVIGDSVNLLSNAWNDSKTKGVLPVASASTTYNVAMISGNQDTTGTAYNGGLENLPRFHENWSGRTCNISGSFVNTWDSQYATGKWVYGGDRYTAPNRNWNYDPAFNNVANLPPYTPLAVSAEDVVSW